MSNYDRKYFSGIEKGERVEIPRNLRILKKIEKYSDKGKILDIGIGSGLFIKLAKKSNWQVYGVDISKYAVDKVKKEVLGVEVELGDFENSKIRENFFDAVNLRHSLEHFKDPERVLRKVYKILKPGGVVSVAVPNSFGIHAKFFGELWPHLSKPYHLHFFSKRSLNKIMESCGFKVLESATEELSCYDLFRLTLNKIGIRCSTGDPSKMTLFINMFLVKMGSGEGLVVVAKK